MDPSSAPSVEKYAGPTFQKGIDWQEEQLGDIITWPTALLLRRRALKEHLVRRADIYTYTMLGSCLLGLAGYIVKDQYDTVTSNIAYTNKLTTAISHDGFTPEDITSSSTIQFNQVSPGCKIPLETTLTPQVSTSGASGQLHITDYHLNSSAKGAKSYSFVNFEDMQQQMQPDVCATYHNIVVAP